jgi:hypothetical protein
VIPLKGKEKTGKLMQSWTQYSSRNGPIGSEALADDSTSKKNEGQVLG